MASSTSNRLSRSLPFVFAFALVLPLFFLRFLAGYYGDLLLLYPVGTILVTACLGYGGGHLFVRLFIGPITVLIEKLKQVGDGDLSVELKTHDRTDEIGELSDTIQMIISRIREKNDQLHEISMGKLDTEIKIISSKDVMGNTIKKMVDSLREMSETAADIARGDLTRGFRPRGSDDKLGRAFEQMHTTLSEMIRELMEQTQNLASAVAQFSSTTAQLAVSTSETASATNEVTTTIEEVRQAANLSNEKAEHVSSLASEAAANSKDGTQATDEAISGMVHIKEEMDLLGDSIMKLSEQTQSIGDIINSVHDIADQSNLLAVNASIEAAKAGDMGKGFSVVAQEIKSLADQSKESTDRIRTILSDIQKASGLAVMATERGAKAVASGYTLAEQAGTIIGNLSDKVVASTDAAIQISASSREQLTGVEQLAQAMTDIKDAGFQNMEGSKQIESGTRDLETMGLKLKEITNRFKI